MKIQNTTEILSVINFEDRLRFLRWLEMKIEQVTKYPTMMPYKISAQFGDLVIDSPYCITINGIEVKI